MNIDAAISYFGSKQKLADAVGVSAAAVSQWGNAIPQLRQFQIQALTAGRLQAESQLAPTMDESCASPTSSTRGPDGSVDLSSIGAPQ